MKGSPDKAQGTVPAASEIRSGPRLTPAWTMEERLHRIEELGRKIAGYIDYMGQVVALGGVSAEAKEHAVTAFYERLVVVEQQLARIQETFRLQ